MSILAYLFAALMGFLIGVGASVIRIRIIHADAEHGHAFCQMCYSGGGDDLGGRPG